MAIMRSVVVRSLHRSAGLNSPCSSRSVSAIASQSSRLVSSTRSQVLEACASCAQLHERMGHYRGVLFGQVLESRDLGGRIITSARSSLWRACASSRVPASLLHFLQVSSSSRPPKLWRDMLGRQQAGCNGSLRKRFVANRATYAGPKSEPRRDAKRPGNVRSNAAAPRRNHRSFVARLTDTS